MLRHDEAIDLDVWEFCSPFITFMHTCMFLLRVTDPDGCEALDGYSLATMHAAWGAGITPHEYVDGARA
jgi:hypothetical protein